MSEALRNTSKIGADRMARMAVVIAAASSVALSVGVIASLIYLLLALASLLTVRPAFPRPASTEAGVREEAAIEQENGDSDLPSALDTCQRIEADAAAPADGRRINGETCRYAFTGPIVSKS